MSTFRWQFELPETAARYRLLVDPNRSIASRELLILFEFRDANRDIKADPTAPQQGLAWSESLKGWFQYVPELSAPEPTLLKWFGIPAGSKTLQLELKEWKANASLISVDNIFLRCQDVSKQNNWTIIGHRRES